jgi:hypothetical protein
MSKLFRAENGNTYISSDLACRARHRSCGSLLCSRSCGSPSAVALGDLVLGTSTREQCQSVFTRGLCFQTGVELLLRRLAPPGTRLEQNARHFQLGILDAGEQLLEGDLQNCDQRSLRPLGLLEETRYPDERQQVSLRAGAVAEGDTGRLQHAFRRRCLDSY